MSQYVTRAFSDGNDIGLQLGKEEWARTLAIGNAWNQIRIGILCAVNPLTPASTAGLPTGAGFVMGICSGKINTFGAATTTNFVGFNCQSSSWSYAANSGQPSQANNGSNFAATRVGTTLTNASLAGGWNFTIPVIGQGSARRFIAIVDILKGSPNYTIRLLNTDQTVGAQAIDYTVSDLKSALVQISGTPTIQGQGMQDHTITIAASEVAGALDTINVYANLSANPFELYEVAVEKLA